MRASLCRLLPFAVFLFIAHGASAETPASGTFIARQPCPATVSIRKGANPGNVSLQPDRPYTVLAKNKPDATHYLIDVPGAEPARRWVAVGCGDAMLADGGGGGGGNGGGGNSGDGNGGGGGGQAGGKPDYVLAVSWQPAFCETKPDKKECETQTADRFDATHFTLHGLWPRKQYCNIGADIVAHDKNNSWDRLPAPELSDETRKALSDVMPGTMSLLDRHEWIKHGTCFLDGAAETYFARSLALMSQLNASKVRDLFAGSIGQETTRAEIRQAFDETFGEGAADRVRVECKKDGGRNLIVEMTIGLSGDITSDSKLTDLIAAAPAGDSGCPRGVVDPVGLQ